jgi:hypothetical protein
MRLIDADALKLKLIGEELDAYAKADFRFSQALSIFQGLINEAPTVEERKYGLWLRKPLAGRPTVRCSCCRTVFSENSEKFAYCPYCGAKMNGGSE